MATSSFRSSADTRPARYRTPSPPRYAFEPLSPTISAISETTNEQIHTRSTLDDFQQPLKAGHESSYSDWHNGRDEHCATMDAFATIALAVNSSPLQTHQGRSNHTPSQLNPENTHHFERPLKRARSEKLPSSQLRRTWTRPATSYEQAFDSRTLEAELLLNFSQEARFASPWPAIPTSGIYTWSRLDATANEIHSPVPDTINQIAEAYKNHATTHEMINKAKQEEGRPNQQGDIHRSTSDGVIPSPNQVLKSPFLQLQAIILQPSEITQPNTELPTSPPNDAIELETNINNRARKEEVIVMELPKVSESLRDIHAASLTDDVQAVKEASGDLSGDQQENAQPQARDDTFLPEQKDWEPSSAALPLPEPPRSCSALGPEEIREDATVPDLSQQETFLRQGEPNAEEIYEDALIEDVFRHGPLQKHNDPNPKETIDDTSDIRATDPQSPPPENETTVPADHGGPPQTSFVSSRIPSKPMTPAVCAACNFTRNSLNGDSENDSTSWICCDACKSWFHFACAGFKSEREVRGVDKFRCRKCKPLYGATTYVRKSSRAHSAIDYAGLHQGVIKTSDENPEHHYIKPIKDGTIRFLPETFARMRPQLVTAEYFERGNGMKEPVIIPANFNPRSKPFQAEEQANPAAPVDAETIFEKEMVEDWLAQGFEVESVPDHGQDALDMVIPRDLTVRKVAELYGPDEKVEVIDVKSQNGENKKWNMRRWVDYYESQGNKIVRNVISLEVSQSKLGRLIRRPQIVRDLDLQDAVWPAELQSKGEYPKVQFYCLMSVADCFTDFHIDFGGSSVFYHILKGKKTFLFIPPKEKHLKKYEEWCMSPAQNWTFLADQTKECYRVDLSEGDTMLIPAGWIHAVWTPEDSLVIGGNFLTRMHYGMQIRVAQVEKATGVARKFRYPYFQKLLWYAAIRYLEDDPLPDSVGEILREGCSFFREQPAYYEFDEWAEDSKSGPENYHARYYSQAELEGLPDLLRYLLRSVLIENGTINEGITQETRNAVKRSIPKGYGEPLDIMKTFAMWCAWKRGNEPIPDWAYASATPGSPEKLSAANMKKASRDSALQGPRRQSARRQSQLTSLTLHDNLASPTNRTSPLTLDNPDGALENLEILGIAQQAQPAEAEGFTAVTTPMKRRLSIESAEDQIASFSLNPPRKRQAVVGLSSHRKPACESCRKRRRACKHRDHLEMASMPPDLLENGERLTVPAAQPPPGTGPSFTGSLPDALTQLDTALEPSIHHLQDLQTPATHNSKVFEPSNSTQPIPWEGMTADLASASQQNKGRSKACNDCRKSKVRNSKSITDVEKLTYACSDVAYTMSLVTRTPSKPIKSPFLDLRPRSSIRGLWRARMDKSLRRRRNPRLQQFP